MELLLLIIFALASLLCGMLVSLVIYARWQYGSLEKVSGLNGVVSPYFVGGSDPFPQNTVICMQDIQNARTYGAVYGVYEGRTPYIHITDLELIKTIFVKDFNSFNFKHQPDTGTPWFNETMDVLDYERWRILRNFISPQFTTSKIRHMSNVLLEAVSDWADVIEKRIEGRGAYECNVKHDFTALTADVVARCFFGVKLNVLEEPNGVFFRLLKDLTFDGFDVGFMLPLIRSFPFLMKIFPSPSLKLITFFVDYLKQILKERRQMSTKVNDVASVMNELLDKCQSQEFKDAGITEVTVLSQAFLLLIAGFETTGTTLPILAYYMATRQDIQDKVQEELTAYLDRHDGKIRHETVGELEYLNACAHEALRMHPPNIKLERTCSKDWSGTYVGPNGNKTLNIKKGMKVLVPLYAVHYDDKHFVDPYKFQPERFLPSTSRPSAFLAFGIGPHSCLGLRFAKEEILLGMAFLLRKFRFEPCEDTRLKLYTGRDFVNTYYPINVRIIQK